MPHLMYQNDSLNVLNIQPGHPTNLNCPYEISKRSGDMQIKEWKNVWTVARRFLEAKGSEAQELETGCSPFSIMESQGLYCFILFYLKEGI